MGKTQKTEAKTTLTAAEMLKLDRVAMEQARSRAQVVRLAVREYCRALEPEKKEGNDGNR